MISSKTVFTAAALLPLLSACGAGNLLGGGGAPAPDPYVAEGNNLTMPPDLALPEPGSGGTRAASVAPDDGAIPDTGEDFADAPEAQPKKAATVQPQQDVYAKYGISKTRADGSKKTEGELYEELRKAQLAEKRRKNPGYGTVFNMGDMFNDN